jgi:hypothetical protein
MAAGGEAGAEADADGLAAAGDQAAAITSEKIVTTPSTANTVNPPATSALVLSPVVICSASGWSAIRERVYRQLTDEETICDFQWPSDKRRWAWA